MHRHRHDGHVLDETRSHQSEISPEAEARIREDERRRLLGADADDWRTTPPPPEDRVDAAAREDVVVERAFSPGQILILLAGVATLVVGIVAVVRTGLDDTLSQPVEAVLGWDHTALLGLFEMGAGILLILAGLRPAGRWLAAIVGAAMIIGGAVILGELDWATEELAAERDFGWAPIIVGAVAILGALVPTRVRRARRTTTVTS
jgi:hypothetical protein